MPMNFTSPFTDDEIQKASAVPTTPDLAIDAWTCGVDTYLQFMKEFMPPGLPNHKSTNARQAAVLDIYTGILGFLVCLRELRCEYHVQGVTACSRSIFELYTDLRLLVADETPLSARRYHTFIAVEHLDKARKRLAFFIKHPEEVDSGTIKGMQTLIRRDGDGIEADAAELWEHHPQHWSGVRGGEARARKAGSDCEVLYFQFYSQLSWFVHTASVGTFGITRERLKNLVPRSLELVRRTVPHTFTIVARELAVEIPDMKQKIAFLENAFFLRLVALKLGQPERFRFRKPRKV